MTRTPHLTARFAFALFLCMTAPATLGLDSAQVVTATCPVIQDTLIRQLTPDTTYVGYPKGWADSQVEGFAGSWIQALLRFDLRACLPAGAEVSSASLQVVVTNASTDPIEIYELLRPFSGTATWKVYTSGVGTGWAVAGAMSRGTDYGDLLASFQLAPLGALTIPLTTSVVQGWVGAASKSIVVRPSGTPGTNLAPAGIGFRSVEHTSGSPPRLSVTYSITDTRPPHISNVTATPSTTSATVRWTTDEAANGQVSYSAVGGVSATTPVSAGGLTSHSHILTGLRPGLTYSFNVLSTDAAGNRQTAAGEFVTIAETSGGRFKIVSWNLHYGKGMTTKAAGMTCPLPGMKDNAQCQTVDNPNTAIDERTVERSQSAWGVGLTQRYLNSATVLGDPEVIALLLTEVNGGTCFSQADLMAVVTAQWPDAVISRAHRDNWIVARWGFAQGVTSYGERDLPPCGYQQFNSTGQLVPWAPSYAEGIQWGKIYAEDPDPDGDGVRASNARTIDVFNSHWPHRGMNADGSFFFCSTNATISRDFMNAPGPGINLTAEPRILGGDLNTEDLVRTTDNVCEPYGGREGFDLLRQAGFADAFAATEAAKTTPTADGSTGMVGRPTTESCYRNYSHNGLYMPYKRIDYQWFRGGTTGRNLRVLSFELIGVEQFGNCVPSDHMGAKVRYQWY